MNPEHRVDQTILHGDPQRPGNCFAANIAAALIDAGHLPAPETRTRYMNDRGNLYRSVGYGPWERISPADVPSAQDALPIGDPA